MKINIRTFSDNFQSGSFITFFRLKFHIVALFLSFMIKIKPSLSINTLQFHYKAVIVTT